jgi:asparagine synthase (glutamine-hydrolysing)
MTGFLGRFWDQSSDNVDFCAKTNLSNENELTLSSASKSLPGLYIERQATQKFKNDKLFHDSEEFFILTEGIILNSDELVEKYKKHSLLDTIILMYKHNGNDFFKEFRGSFAGLIFDKKNKKKIVYTNHTGDKPIFYSQQSLEIVFSSNLNYLLGYFKKNKLPYSLNKEAVYHLLTYGGMLEDNTIFNEIKKLRPGCYLILENSNFQVKEYYRINNEPNYDQSENEIIDNIDKLFRQAIKRAFEKDRAFGYKHLVSLSGGLDSRMTTWVANDMGYGDNIVNYTFSQSDYLDAIVPRQIASDLKHEWIFKFLDNGVFLKNIDDAAQLALFGTSFVPGKSFFDLLNKDRFGIAHTGMLGDSVLGATYCSSKQQNMNFSLTTEAPYTILSHKLNQDKIKLTYANGEIFGFYVRGFNFLLPQFLVIQETLETYSPFCDVDFLDYCLKIPLELRYKHYIYFKWVLTKYPKATDYTLERLKYKITDPRLLSFFGISINKFLELLKYANLYAIAMNPYADWYDTNSSLKTFMDKYFAENIPRLNFDEELKKDCAHLYTSGSGFEKTHVMILLSALKLYF